jgi:hypothetical protein
MTAVCIAGMHRSGTSMITRLVHMSGLALGPSNDLLVPTTDNPEGYWERRSLMMVNDAILASFGGGWDMPPALPENWTTAPELVGLRADARTLLSAFDGEQYWGWKDPRNSITMPFWQELIPGLKALVCVRNPIEVARSLASRGYASQPFSFKLWLDYNRAVLANTTPEQRVVTHYHAYFADPEAELRRVCDELGIPATDHAISTACSTTKSGLRHSVAVMDDLLGESPSAELITTYMQLCNEAGPVYGQVLERELANLNHPLPDASESGTAWVDRWRAQRLEAAVRTLAEHVQTSEQQLQEMIRELSAKQLEASQLQARIRQLEQQYQAAG